MIAEFPPNSGGGGGALARQLLQGYPGEQICWWSYRPEPRRGLGQRVDRHFYCPVPPKLYPHRKCTRLKSWLMENIWSPWAAAHLRRVVAEAKPDQIWSVLYDWPIAILHATKRLPARWHVSVWDYPDSHKHAVRWGRERAERFERYVEEMYKTATTCDVISEPMLADLAARTGRADALVLHSGLEACHVESLASPGTDSNQEIRIAYAGTIIVPNVFRFFIRALETIRADLPLRVVIDIFGGGACLREPWFNREWMQDHGHLDEAEFHAALQRCTWGFLPMGLTDGDPRYNRFSFPNKFGTYLTAGLPLLVLAHRESSAAKMIRAYNVGLHTDTTDLDQLILFLRRAFAEPRPKQRFRGEILRCARTEFDSARMRKQLWDCFGVR